MAKARISVRAAAPRSGGGQTPKLGARALQLGPQQVPLYSGAVHYFRLKPNTWRAALEALRSLGLNMVETYVPWGVHELRDGSYDFGQYDPQKDLGAFLDLAHALGMYAFVRPGPNINAELTYFGLPRRVVFDEACQARSARGQPLPFIAPPRMFPVPSFASDRFFHEVERWYAEASKVLASRIWPNGPVVMVQVDNEAAFYFRDAPYDHDHHPDALAKYRAFLQVRYEDLATLNSAHGTEYTDWENALPATRCPHDASHAVLRRSLDLMEFQSELLAGALERLRGMLSDQLGPLPTVHNSPMGESGLPTTLARLDHVVDVNGIDYYHRRTDMNSVKARTLRLAGSVRLPYAPEMGIGAPPWFAARSDADGLHTLLCACAFGLRGLNLYMAVDRDRWYGAPFDELARERPQAEDLRRIIRALHRTHFHTLKRRVEVGIMLPAEYARLSRATHTLGAMSPSLLALAGAGADAACLQTDLGFQQPIQLAWNQYVARAAKVLDRARVPYVFVESEASKAQLEELRVVITPTYEFADPKRLELLTQFRERGGRLVCGPHTPHLDDQLQPLSAAALRTLADLPLSDISSVEPVLSAMIAELNLATPFTVRPAEVEAAVHEDPTGPRVVFLLHTRNREVLAELNLPEPMVLVDALTGERYEGRDQVAIPLAGDACRMFVCERTTGSASRSRPPSARRSYPPC
jgi:beta-galactosidase